MQHLPSCIQTLILQYYSCCRPNCEKEATEFKCCGECEEPLGLCDDHEMSTWGFRVSCEQCVQVCIDCHVLLWNYLHWCRDCSQPLCRNCVNLCHTCSDVSCKKCFVGYWCLCGGCGAKNCGGCRCPCSSVYGP